MNRRCFSVIALGAVLLLGTGAAPHKLVATWVNPDHAGLTLQKIAIVGISADREIRHRFEDKFVSHLRGRDHDAVTSYSLVPNLAMPEDREALLLKILEQKIDSVLSVRAVRLKDRTEDEWSDSWRSNLKAGTTLRTIVSETLPHTGEKAHRYGVEIGLWDAVKGQCIWAARTDLYSTKELKKGAAELVQFVMNELERAKLLPD
jgi:hypothetical protein